MLEGVRGRPPESRTVRIVGASELHAELPYEGLVEALRATYRGGATVPDAAVYAIEAAGGEWGELELAPAWKPGKHIGIGLHAALPASAHPGAPGQGFTYVLLDARTGAMKAVFDGAALAARRTAATAALAAAYLARPDCERLLIIGADLLANQLLEAMAAVRPIHNVLVWDRDTDRAARVAHRLDRRELKVRATAELGDAVRGAHIIACADSWPEPVLKGEWLPKGSHVTLVGAAPGCRAVDDDCIGRARVFLDLRDGSARLAGDIAEPLGTGRLQESDIAGDLVELARGVRAGRRYYDQITLFQSGSSPLGDLAAASLFLELAVAG